MKGLSGLALVPSHCSSGSGSTVQPWRGLKGPLQGGSEGYIPQQLPDPHHQILQSYVHKTSELRGPPGRANPDAATEA